MNRTLQRRIELLETRLIPAWEPLRIVIASLPSDYVVGIGERVVEDEFPENQDMRYPLMLTVHQRIATDPNDHGMRWSDQV